MKKNLKIIINLLNNTHFKYILEQNDNLNKLVNSKKRYYFI